MASIPASAIVSVVPSVISAGGSALELIGLCLTTNTRVPVGSVLSFPSSAAVGAYFGPASNEATEASVYFQGFAGSNVLPAAMLFAQYNQAAVPAYLRGGSLASLTLAQLQALSGTLSVTVEGVTKTSSTINFASATSFSNAAAMIQTGFAAYDAVTAATTTIAAGTATSVTGSIAGYTLTVSAVSTGALVVGGVLSGTGITAGTTITGQLTGAAGGVGTYSVSANQTVSSTTITQSYGLMTVATVSSGTLAVGQVISGTGITVGTTITALGTGTGGAGTYITSGGAQTVSATTVSAGPLTCAYDSVSSAFILTGGTPGAAGTISFATGSLSASLALTSATGAVTSQGAAPSVPATFMANVVAQTTNWATFFTAFDPDNGYGNAVKLQFSNWVGTTSNQFAYICWDTDVTPTLSSNATSSFGQLIQAAGISGVIPVWESGNLHQAAFASGAIASIDFTETNGEATLAFKSQSGIVAGVTNATVAANLIANGYNFYGAYATANQGFQFFYPGLISGPFKWADAYVGQIWLNSQLQLALMELLTNVKSIPYNASGYALINAAMQDPIAAAVNFGLITPGTTLSAAQIAEVNNAAGVKIANILQSTGYYLQILPGTAQVRGARTSPPITLWYCQGGSVQSINVSSVEVQ
jgi:hypothetical protein